MNSIIRDLYEQHDVLVAAGEDIPDHGYSKAKVSFAVEISEKGELVDIIPFLEDNSKLNFIFMKVPFRVDHTNKIVPCFACDTPKYVFGVESSSTAGANPVTARSKQCFEAFKENQHEILDGIEDSRAHALLAFVDSWEPEQFLTHPKIQEHKNALLKGGNCVFVCNNSYVHESSVVKTAWEQHYDSGNENNVVGQCSITGKTLPIARLHNKIVGVFGTGAFGAPLVSFNHPAFNSYNKTQGFNAPVGVSVMNKYTTVLNHFLREERHHALLGGDTVVFWAKTHNDAGSQCEDLMHCLINAPSTNVADAKKALALEDEKTQQIRKAIKSYNAGILPKIANADKDTMFYVLGLAPAEGRLIVHFYFENTLGELHENVARYCKDMEIVRSKRDMAYYPPNISTYTLLREASPAEFNADNKKKYMQRFNRQILDSILNGRVYPISLYNAMLSRTILEGTNCVRIGFIKAYLLRLIRAGILNIPEESITVALNTECKNVPYRLGRLFATLAKIQAAAIKSLNSGLGEQFISRASSTPASVFPKLLVNAEHHLTKIQHDSYGLSVWYRKLLQEILFEIDPTAYPKHLNNLEQGLFMLGYHHQTQDFYTKKDDIESLQNSDAKNTEKQNEEA